MNPPRKQYKMVKRVIQIHCGLKMAIYKFILIFALFVTITDGSSKFYYIQLIVNSVFTTLLFRISKINKEKKNTECKQRRNFRMFLLSTLFWTDTSDVFVGLQE